ncbi:MAG: hypothetical protein HQ581_19740 [Planctomycetes bacterium]|nr:hypothetical protein [Planctomycetota bacterium]
MTTRPTMVAAGAMILATLALVGPAPAANVLEVIPADALGFVTVNRLADADAKLVSLGERMKLPIPSALTAMKTMAGIKEGLDEKGTMAWALFSAGEEEFEPVMIGFVPVTDYQAFIAQLKPEKASAKITTVEVGRETLVVGQAGDFAVMAEASERRVLKRVLKSTKNIAGQLAPMQVWLDENDGSLVVTRQGIEAIATAARKGLKDAKEAMGAMGDEGQMAIAGLSMYDGLFDAMEAEVDTFAAGARLDDQGNTHLLSRTRFVAGGQAAKMAGDFKGFEGHPLAGLPSGPFVFAGAGVMPEGMAEAVMKMSIGMMKAMPQLYGLDEEQAEKLLRPSIEMMKSMHSMSMRMGVGKENASLYSEMNGIMRVDDAASFMADYAKYMKAFSSAVGSGEGAMKGLFKIKSKEIEIDGRPALQFEMAIPTAGMGGTGPGAVEMEKMMAKMFGPGGKIMVYIAAADEHTVVFVYTSRDELRRCIEAVRNPQGSLSADPGVAKTDALLPENAPWVGYWSPGGTVAFVQRMMGMFVPEVEKDFKIKIPDFPETPPVGFAANLTSGELQTDLVVPAAVLQATGKYIAEVQMMIQMNSQPLDLDRLLHPEAEVPEVN